MPDKIDIVIIMNAKGLDTLCVGNVHRLPLIQALAGKVKTRGKILAVTAPASLLAAPFNDSRGLSSYKITPSLRKMGENIFVFTPRAFLPVSVVDRCPAAVKLFRHCMRRQLRKAMAESGFLPDAQRALWVMHPYHLYYAGLVDEKIMLYECYDEFTIFGQRKLNKRIQRAEMELAENSRLIFATSEKMAGYFSRINANTHYFPNAVDFTLFNKALDPAVPLAESMKHIPGPIIGFMGNISDWYDYGLLRQVAGRNKGWSFVFIGHIEKNVKNKFRQLEQFKNVRFLGWKSYYDLPRYLKGFDAAIMPYKLNTFTRSVNPNKLYQFLAAGIPVASTPLPEVARFEGIVETGEGAAGFANAIKRALDKKTAEDIDKMTSAAFENSWERRAGMALDLIIKNL